MAVSKKTTKTKASSSKKTKVKVPKNGEQVSIVVLECGNCGAEDEKVFYCSECDSPMRVVEVVEKEEKYVKENDMISKDTAGSAEVEENDEIDSSELKDELGMSEEGESVDDIIENGGLGDIFSGGESGEVDFSSGDDGDDDDPASLDDIVSALDDE